jgi:hypothetical protein
VFRSDFDQVSLLVGGSKGSGKSSLIGALLWALSGERPRDHADSDAHEAKPVTVAVNGSQRQICAFFSPCTEQPETDLGRVQTSTLRPPRACASMGGTYREMPRGRRDQ